MQDANAATQSNRGLYRLINQGILGLDKDLLTPLQPNVGKRDGFQLTR